MARIFCFLYYCNGKRCRGGKEAELIQTVTTDTECSRPLNNFAVDLSLECVEISPFGGSKRNCASQLEFDRNIIFSLLFSCVSLRRKILRTRPLRMQHGLSSVPLSRSR